MSHATRPLSRRIDADSSKVRKCLGEAQEHLQQIAESGNPDLAELAAAALWDLVLEYRMAAGWLAPR